MSSLSQESSAHRKTPPSRHAATVGAATAAAAAAAAVAVGAHSRHNNQSRCRRPSRHRSSVQNTFKTLATTTAVAYGAYKAYEYYHANDDDDVNGVDGHNNQEGKTENNESRNKNIDTNLNEQQKNPSIMRNIGQSFISSVVSSLDMILGGNDNDGDASISTATMKKDNNSTSSSSPGTPGSATTNSTSATSSTAVHINSRTRQRLAQQSLRKCRKEVIKAYETCWPAIQQVIDTQTDTIAKTKELRKLRNQHQNNDSRSDNNINNSHNTTEHDVSISTSTPSATATSTGTTTATTTAAAAAAVTMQAQQDKLWKDIQLETFTRYITTVYASPLLFLSLTMQLHWIGGQVFHRKYHRDHDCDRDYQRHPSPIKDTANPRLAQQVLMEAHEYMTTQGIPILVAAVRRALQTTAVTNEWTASSLIGMVDIDEVLTNVQQYLETGGSNDTYNIRSTPTERYHSCYTRNWIRIILPDPYYDEEDSDSDDSENEDEEDDGNDGNESKEEGRKKEIDEHNFVPFKEKSRMERSSMLEAFWDLAESPAWQDAQVQSFNIIQHFMKGEGWAGVFAGGDTHGITNGIGLASLASSAPSRPPSFKTTSPQVPLAKMMAPLKTACHLVGSRPTEKNKQTKKNKSSMQRLQKLASLAELGDICFHASV